MAEARQSLFALVASIVASGAHVSASDGDVGVPAVSAKDAPRYQGAVRPVRLDPSVGASAEQLDAQFEALSRIPDARVVYAARGTTKSILGRSMFGITPQLQLPRDQQVIEGAIRPLRVVFLATGTEQLTIEYAGDASNGGILVIVSQTIRGVPVWGSKIGVRTHPRTGWVEIYGEFLPDRNLATDTRISQADAHEAALRWASEYEVVLRNRPRIVAPEIEPRQRETGPPLFSAADVSVTRDAALYYTTESGALVWFVEVGDGRDFNQRLGVDAQSGEVLFNNETAAYIGTRVRAGVLSAAKVTEVDAAFREM